MTRPEVGADEQPLALTGSPERVCDVSCEPPTLDAVATFCRTWAEVGRSIMLRRRMREEERE